MRKHRKKLWIILLILLLLGIGTYFYMLFEYQNIKITQVALPNLPQELEGIKIVYVADFQYDQSWKAGSIKEKVFQKSIDMILAEKPDLILLGGDYATHKAQGRAMIPFLSQLEAPLGVYGVFGNHDYWSREIFIEELRENITFLENEEAVIPYGDGALHLFGVDDYWKGEPSISGLSTEGAEGYSLLLTHNPDYFESLAKDSRDLFDLSLAGHIHGGQIAFFGIAGIPFVLDTVTRFGETYRYGYKTFDENAIYITSGLGGSVFQQSVRFGAQPEIVVLQ